MRELSRHEFKRVINLLNNEQVHCTFAYSVIEDKQEIGLQNLWQTYLL